MLLNIFYGIHIDFQINCETNISSANESIISECVLNPNW